MTIQQDTFSSQYLRLLYPTREETLNSSWISIGFSHLSVLINRIKYFVFNCFQNFPNNIYIFSHLKRNIKAFKTFDSKIRCVFERLKVCPEIQHSEIERVIKLIPHKISLKPSTTKLEKNLTSIPLVSLEKEIIPSNMCKIIINEKSVVIE